LPIKKPLTKDGLFEKHYGKLGCELSPSHTFSDSYKITASLFDDPLRQVRSGLAGVLRYFEYGCVQEVKKYDIDSREYVTIYNTGVHHGK